MYTRDKNSNAVLNNDAAALNKYKQERALHRNVTALAEEISDIKICITRICERLDLIEKN
jgi:hypothetical protein